MSSSAAKLYPIIVKKLFSLFLLAKVYSNYKVQIYNKVVFGNPLINIFKQVLSSVYTDVAAIIPSMQIFGNNQKAVKGGALVSLNFIIFILVIYKILKEILIKFKNNNLNKKNEILRKAELFLKNAKNKSNHQN